MSTVEQCITEVLTLTRELETMPSWGLGLKLAEETGEVCTAVLYDHGFLQHKQLEEGLFNECADVINVLLGLLTQHFPNMTVDEIKANLVTAMIQKTNKYKKIMEQTDVQ